MLVFKFQILLISWIQFWKFQDELHKAVCRIECLITLSLAEGHTAASKQVNRRNMESSSEKGGLEKDPSIGKGNWDKAWD